MTTQAADRKNRNGTAPADLTHFQTRILAVLTSQPQHGLGVKDDLEAYYEGEINHGRLYQNLDQLADRGLVRKEKADGRTNTYYATQTGASVITSELDWLADKLSVTVHTNGGDEQ